MSQDAALLRRLPLAWDEMSDDEAARLRLLRDAGLVRFGVGGGKLVAHATTLGAADASQEVPS